MKGGIKIDTFILHKALLLAVLTEIITNMIKTIVPKIDKTHIPTIAGAIGIMLAWLTGVGLFNTLGIPLKIPTIDYLLTGIIVSRGANVVHDLAKKLNY